MNRVLVALVVLGTAACAAAPAVQQSARSGSPAQMISYASPEPRELLPDEQVQQVLNRLTFGPRPGEAEKVRAMGVDRWIDQQLRPEQIDDRAADELVSHYETLNEKTSDLVQTFREVQQARRREQMQLKQE